jgi:fibro-slime domain-containing protein
MRPLVWTLTTALAFSLACSANGPRENSLGDGKPSASDDGSGKGSGTSGNGSSDPTKPGTSGNTSGEANGEGESNGSSGIASEDGELFITPDDQLIDVANAPAPAGCGDGNLTADEACDDGNLDNGDGCMANCLQLEPGFSCAEPGEACIAIARCGDSFVAPSEECDDGNSDDGDGCSSRCRVELGSKCEGSPSACSPTTCGDGIQEGAEACDDGNSEPFDGCSALCLREPNCEGLSCTSDCGDGLVINEECDDGNQISGDGCSADCTIENGFSCVRDFLCEKVNGECVLRVPTIFRDFSGSHPDFGDHTCSDLAQGAVEDQLDAQGHPVLLDGKAACITNGNTFSEWYVDGDNQVMVGDIVLFDNGRGGYVNRFDSQGTYFTSIDPESEVGRGGSLADCESSCASEARNNWSAGCDNHCRPDTDAVRQANEQLDQAVNNELPQARMQAGGAAAPVGDGGAAEPAVVQEVLDKIDELEAEIEELTATADACMDECTTGVADETAACADTCGPCSYSPDSYCTGGELVEWEGNPLFFPVDSLTGPTTDFDRAKIPEQYGYNGWPWEDAWFPDAPDHNFYFTSQVQYWFQYDEDFNATLDFLGDDDVWVFINGHLAVDIGGIHVPVEGSVTINAAAGTLQTHVAEPESVTETNPTVANDTFTAAQFGLEPGNVYKITIFQAERQMEGSSFKLTLSGFEATPSDCTAICGDGILSFGEECDDGVNDGGYGECAADCKLGPFCGDGIVQESEDCDNGPGGGDGCPNCRILLIK